MSQRSGNTWNWDIDKLRYYPAIENELNRYYREHRTAPLLQYIQKACNIKNARAVRRTLELMAAKGKAVKTPDNRYIPAWAFIK
jgi:hypothetical protein